MNKTLTYTGFAIAALGIVLAFVTAKTYTQLAIATVLYPALIYFALKMLSRSHGKGPVITIPIPLKPAKQIATTQGRKVEVTDIDKRTFLKMIGAAGISFFVFSILGRRVDNLLFNKPSENADIGASPATLSTSGYRISEIDEGEITYYGFINGDGGWLIMREDTDSSSFRYAKGDLNFPGSWASRGNLKYDYYYNLN